MGQERAPCTCALDLAHAHREANKALALRRYAEGMGARTMKEIVMVYVQHVEQSHVRTAELPMTAINSREPFGTCRRIEPQSSLPAGFSSMYVAKESFCDSLRMQSAPQQLFRRELLEELSSGCARSPLCTTLTNQLAPSVGCLSIMLPSLQLSLPSLA
jgi:hypothetical protein